MEVVLGRKTLPKQEHLHVYLTPNTQGQIQACPPIPAQLRPTTACVAMGTVDAEVLLVSQPLHPAHFKAVQVQLPCSLPPLNDGDDIVHLDVQLVWFFKVLKGPHVSGLGLRAETCHCPP